MFKNWNPVYDKKHSNSVFSILDPAKNSLVEVAKSEEIPPAKLESPQEQKEMRSPVAVNIPLQLHEPGSRPFSLLCPKCGATDNFYFKTVEPGGNSKSELSIICGYCHNKLLPGKHYAGTARRIYGKLLLKKEE